MNMLSWNCKGLRKSHNLVIPRIKDIHKNYFPEILFLMETMHSRDVLAVIQEWLGYARVYTVESIGKSGGLALSCKKNVTLEIKYVDNNLFHVSIKFELFQFYLSCIYEDHTDVNMPKIWERIYRIGIMRTRRWCILGDFNDILHNGIKKCRTH